MNPVGQIKECHIKEGIVAARNLDLILVFKSALTKEHDVLQSVNRPMTCLVLGDVLMKQVTVSEDVDLPFSKKF